jgi:hypothetical protein
LNGKDAGQVEEMPTSSMIKSFGVERLSQKVYDMNSPLVRFGVYDSKEDTNRIGTFTEVGQCRIDGKELVLAERCPIKTKER